MTGLRELGEFGFINQVARLAGAAPQGVLGIGDDCAVIDVGKPEKLVITNDFALEGRHFSFNGLEPFEIGQRAVAGALSDIAAMGARPFVCLCTIMISSTMSQEQVMGVMRGVTETATRYGAPLIGGDTVAGAQELALDIIVLGWTSEPWLRSGARAGDRLLLTGSLGKAAAALSVLQTNPALLREPELAELLKRLANPTPRLAQASALAGRGLVHAAIDISDGLYQDAGHLAKLSQVRIEIQAKELPVSKVGSIQAIKTGTISNAPWWAATSGDEYELLLCVDRELVREVQETLIAAGLPPLTDIGDVVPGEGVVLISPDGSGIELERGGWDHFRVGDTLSE